MIQILGLLGMYFDAVVVEVKTFYTFILIGPGLTVFSELIKNLLDVPKSDIFVYITKIRAATWSINKITYMYLFL